MKCIIYLTILSCILGSLASLKLLKQNVEDVQSFINQFRVRYLQKGDGRSYPYQGDRVKVHYIGTFPDSGRKFDSSRDRNQPFAFNLGAGEVIRCWDMVVSQLTIGDRVKVICPSRLAYGEQGAGRDIPPNTDIAFDIEMLGINS